MPYLLRAGAPVDPTLEKLRRFGTMLLEWNRGVSNLISRNDEARLVERHFFESLEPAHWLREAGLVRWIDLGSGGGFPAIPLALAGLGTQWTLVESRRNKCLFLRKTIAELGLHNVVVQQARLESLVEGGEMAGAFDGFTSRATATLVPTLEMAAHVVRPDGKAFLWKGSSAEDERGKSDAWRPAWEYDGRLGIGDGRTSVLRFTRRAGS